MNNSLTPVGQKGPIQTAIALIVSLVLPGIGQAVLGQIRRGLLLFMSFVTILGLLIWRIRVVARREPNFQAMLPKAFDLQPVLLVVTVGVAVIYLWLLLDVFRKSRGDHGSNPGLWAVVLVVYFAMGWQVGQIDLVKLFSEITDAKVLIGQIAWPWPRAVYREEQLLVAGTDVRIPCFGTLPEAPAPEPDQPYLFTDPRCGELSTPEGEAGSTLHVTGTGFQSLTETEIWWIDDLRNEFRQRQGGQYLKLTSDEQGAFEVDVVIPYRLIPPAEQSDFSTWKIQARQLHALGPAEPSEELILGIEKMIETIFLGMMATFFGIVLAVPISFPAARNLMSSTRITLLIYYLTRTMLNIIRSIEPLIWAVIAIIVVGLGPFAGIVALTIHSVAALGKLYSEAIESIDPGPIEAIQATGANWLQIVRYGVLPQVIPPFVSFTIYRWDINVRMSTVIGLVGGGGIGFVLIQWIHLLDYRAAGIAVWFITMTVALLDFVSSEIRQRFV